MSDNMDNMKEKFDETMKTVKEKAQTKGGKIAIVIVLLILVLNVFSTMMDGKVAAQLETFKQEFKAPDSKDFEERVKALESRSIDLNAVKAEVESIKSASTHFESRLGALIKAEEARLQLIEKDMESYKAYIENLKGLSGGK